MVASAHQKHLAGTAGFLMVILGIPLPPTLRSLTDMMTLQWKPLPDGTLWLYLIELVGAPVFKLGAFKSCERYGRTTIHRRYFKQNGDPKKTPATPSCFVVNFDLNHIKVRKLVQISWTGTCEDECTDDEHVSKRRRPTRPDDDLHKLLRKRALELDFFNTGSTEFHDRALIGYAEELMDSMAI
jgi:hypothetical protein